jgi:hypothetical protein
LNLEINITPETKRTQVTVTATGRKNVNVTLANDNPPLLVELNHGRSGIGATRILKDVLANTTQVVDIIPMSSFRSLEYLISYHGGLPLKDKTFKFVCNQAETLVETQAFAITGNSMKIGIDVFVSGQNAEVRVVNQENYNIKFAALKQTL